MQKRSPQRGGYYYRPPPGQPHGGPRPAERGGMKTATPADRNRQREAREFTNRNSPAPNNAAQNRQRESLPTPKSEQQVAKKDAAKEKPVMSAPATPATAEAGRPVPSQNSASVQSAPATPAKPAPEKESPVQNDGRSSAAAAASSVEAALKERPAKRKFTNRCRLFVGNLPQNMTEAGLKEMFLKYGQVSEIYLQASRSFGFVRLDTRANAEKAKEEMDGATMAGREVRVRFASLNCSLSIEGLHNLVSNELLVKAFSQFGDVERAVVFCDEKGKSTGKGLVDFARRNYAQNCIKACTDGCFLLTKSPMPVIVKAMDTTDDPDGVQERTLVGHPSFEEERQVEPRFARPGTFEFKVASQWKALGEAEKAQRELLEKQIREARQQLHTELEQSMLDQQAESMRQELQRRQDELERFEEHRRSERAKFADQQRRHEGQRRDEYFDRQGTIFRQHGNSSNAVETFLRGRGQLLEDMFHGHGPADSGMDGTPMPMGEQPHPGPGPGQGPPGPGPMGDELPPPVGRETLDNGVLSLTAMASNNYYESTSALGGSHNRAPPPGMHPGMNPGMNLEGDNDPEWQTIAAAVSRIQTLGQDERGPGVGGPPPHHGFAPAMPEGRDGPPPPQQQQQQQQQMPPPGFGMFHGGEPGQGQVPFQPRGPHSHPTDHRLGPMH